MLPSVHSGKKKNSPAHLPCHGPRRHAISARRCVKDGSSPFGPSTLSAVLSLSSVARSRILVRSPDVGDARYGAAAFPGVDGMFSCRSAAHHSQIGAAPAKIHRIFFPGQAQVQC